MRTSILPPSPQVKRIWQVHRFGYGVFGVVHRCCWSTEQHQTPRSKKFCGAEVSVLWALVIIFFLGTNDISGETSHAKESGEVVMQLVAKLGIDRLHFFGNVREDKRIFFFQGTILIVFSSQINQRSRKLIEVGFCDCTSRRWAVKKTVALNLVKHCRENRMTLIEL